MKNRFKSSASALVLAGVALGAAGPVLAQSAQPGSGVPLVLGTIILQPELTGDETATSLVEKLRADSANASAAVSIVGAEDFEDVVDPTVAEAFALVPGVVVQEFFSGNDQPRVQIRGSGIQQNPTERGLVVLNNGLPVNRADGSYVVGLASPGTAEAIEVFRGAAANRLGATVLGGAVNFISPTASTSPGTELSFGTGSFGRVNINGKTTVQGENVGAALTWEFIESDGFRVENNDSHRYSVGLNVELSHSDNAATQLFMSYTDLAFDVAGPLTWAALQTDPSQVHPGPTVLPPIPPGTVVNPGPNVPRDQPRRETTQALLGSRTTIDVGQNRYDFGFSYASTDDSFRFPISSAERVTNGWDVNLFGRYSFGPEAVNGQPRFEVNVNYALGEADRLYYNHSTVTPGARGPMFGDMDLESSTFSINAGANFDIGRNLVISPSVSYTYANRTNTDNWTDPTRPTVAFHPVTGMALPNGTSPTVLTDYDLDYSGWSPRLALTWKPSENQTVWVAASHGFEPPTHDDLMVPANGTPNSGPGRPMPPAPVSADPAFATVALEPQEVDTIELGWRGQLPSGFGWDVTAYHSWITNEILSPRNSAAGPAPSINADKTLHTGVELGISGPIGDRLFGRLAYTYQDFRFDNDSVYGNNRIAGAPKHVVNAALSWMATDDLTVTGSVRWVPDEVPVDNNNTLFTDDYVVANLRADYRLNDTVSLYAEVTNLFDEKYAASTVVVHQARPDQAGFIPGEERAFYIGAALNF